MSEQILKALMQLFAIIARPESNRRDRRSVVETFLSRQLNQDIVHEYLRVFDYFYNLHQDKQKERGKKTISSSSVKVLKICHQINEELTQQQKFVVLIQLFEFVISDSDEVTEQEYEFIRTVADSFHISPEEHNRIRAFIAREAEPAIEPGRLLVIEGQAAPALENVRRLVSEMLDGRILVLHIAESNLYLFKYQGQAEMYLNGQLLAREKVYVFNIGSSIRNPHIKPIYYSDVVSCFNQDMLKHRIVFEVRDVSFHFRAGNLGLRNISFTEESGRMVGIMGASGAGKSTLLNVLNGSTPPSKGQLLINGIDVYKDRKTIEGLIGHVAQDDLLIEELTVLENLYYNARLCFDNYSEGEIRELVDNTLINLGLYEIKDVPVGTPLNKKISGGQRKRLNIALELIREPAVLFLDEPTSGLSSRDSENIMDLLKELTLKGKLIFVVIHQPSSDIFKMFDRLIILDTGGYLIYNGDPIEAIIYFKEKIHHANWSESECHVCGNVNPEQIFNIVEANVLDEYGKVTKTRRIAPREWAAHYEKFTEQNTKKPEPASDLPPITFKIPGIFKQFGIFVQRDILSKISDNQYLLVNLLEAPLLGFILSYIIKYYNISATNEFGYTFESNSNLPVYIFMSVIVAIFMGMTVSAEEIIKDRKILKREQFLHLSWGSYLASKIMVLFILSAIQAITFVLVGNSIMEIKGMYLEYWLVLFSAWACSNIIGLVISDSFKTVVTIYILIPFLVIPQIVLSGVIVKYDKLNPKISSPKNIPFYGEIITARWAYEALAVYQFMHNRYQEQFYPFDKAMSRADFKKNYWITTVESKVELLERHLQKPEEPDKVKEAIEMLRYEIGKENQMNPLVRFAGTQNLHPDKIGSIDFESLKQYIANIRKYYIQYYNIAYDKKNNYISQLQDTPAKREEFLALKRQFNNEKLTEFVENKRELVRLVEYKGRIYQKYDPIYLEPENFIIKAHFYAPKKAVFGRYVDTFWVNIAVMWLMAMVSMAVLYYRLLKRFVDNFENKSRKLQED